MTSANQTDATHPATAPPARLSKEEINLLPIGRWEGETHLIQTTGEVEAAASVCSRTSLLGFDTETRPSFRKGQSYAPSLLQLATDREVFLFQLRHSLPEPLLAILSAPGIVKAGVGLKDDLLNLQALMAFVPQGFVDLAVLARQRGLAASGLRGLAAAVCGIRISKSARTTNWARPDLSPQQIQYAATDAWIGREIYKRLKTLPEGPPHHRPRHV